MERDMGMGQKRTVNRMATNKEPEFSHYEQSERKYTEAELQELFDRLRKEPLMLFSLPRQNGKTAIREQLSMKWNVPPKDMVEVVRCKDCKLLYTEECNMRNGFYDIKDDDYCSYGERKEK